MKNFACLAALAAVATIAATPAAAQNSANANATLRVTKPLILTRDTHLDFGTVVVWGNGVVDMEQDGTISCTVTTLTCDATGTPATFSIQGTNNRVVDISAPATVTLSNGAGSDLTLNTDFPGTRTLNSSGVGNTTQFSIAGTVALAEATPAGTYTGTMNVTVSYQ